MLKVENECLMMAQGPTKFFFLPAVRIHFNNSILGWVEHLSGSRALCELKFEINFLFNQTQFVTRCDLVLSCAKTIQTISFGYEIHELMKVLKLQ